MQNEATQALDDNTLPTFFDQTAAISSALSKELGLVPSEIVPRHQIELPQWCQNIVKQLRKTVFKPVLKLHSPGATNWRKYGRSVGILQRYKTFLEHDLPRILEEEWADITDAQWEQIEPRLGLDSL